MKDKIYLYGFGGLGRDIEKIFKREGIEISGYIDDSLEKQDGIRVFSLKNILEVEENIKILIAIGDPKIKNKIYEKIKQYNKINLYKFVSKDTINLSDNKIEEGVFIYPYCFIGENVKIEKNVIICSQASIGHDVIIKESSTIAFNVSVGGNTKIEKNTYIGSGANIKDELSIGENCIIGMGSTVLNIIEENTIYYSKYQKIKKINNIEGIF